MSIECEELKAQVAQLDAQQELVLCEKARLKEHVARMDGEVKRLNDHVGALTLEDTGLSERKTEVEVVGEIAARGVLEKEIT